MIQIYNKLEKIPNLLYEGYIWGADQKSPTILKGEQFKLPFDSSLYIVEGLLYSKAEQISIHIRHTGELQICEYDLKEYPKGSKRYEVDYLPHRLEKNIKKVRFQQLWIPEKDPNCEDWEVLKMKALIFFGFKPSFLSTQQK